MLLGKNFTLLPNPILLILHLNLPSIHPTLPRPYPIFTPFLAAVMLRFAFPHKIYAERENTQVNPTNTSDNFRSVMNPRDMWSDTVKNFAPSYSNYAHIDEGDNVSRSEQPI